jgi:hypothetical protein
MGAETFLHQGSGDVARGLQDWNGGADIILLTAP